MDRSEFDAPSKTRVKQAMLELQKLGETLLEFPDGHLDDIEMEDNLRDALRAARLIRSREARRRQLQYIGKQLRSADVEPLRRAIADYRAGQHHAAQAFQELEDWRRRLLEDDTAVTAWMVRYPITEVTRLRRVIRDARHEQATQPNDTGGKRRHYRELFRLLRMLAQQGQ